MAFGRSAGVELGEIPAGLRYRPSSLVKLDYNIGSSQHPKCEGICNVTIIALHFQWCGKQVDPLDQPSPSLTSNGENSLEFIDFLPPPSFSDFSGISLVEEWKENWVGIQNTWI